MCLRLFGGQSGWVNIPSVQDEVRRFPRFIRDWRIRTIVPVLLVNVLAFAGLYLLMYHWSVSNIVQTRKLTADILFDEILFDFGEQHGASSVLQRLERHARAHQLIAVNVIPSAVPPALPLQWKLENNHIVTFTRAIPNRGMCQGCHGTTRQSLAVMQLGFDLSKPIAEAGQRVRSRFAVAGVAWLGVLALFFWTGRVVIGRPLRKIEQTIGGSEAGETRDLTELAQRVDRKLWNLIDGQRQREQDITRHMARAEQLAALGQVAAGLTHEIKNPLAGVIAALEVLRSEEKDSDHDPLFEEMLAELRRVTGTVDGLLRLAKPQPPQRASVDLGRVVREVTSLFRARVRRQGVTLDVEAPDEVPPLQLDSGLMVQLLVNLLTNSLQATDRGGTVRVLLAAFPRRDGVALAVSDTGKGIDAEQLQHVFDPFFTTKEEGTGLGLPICRQIVEQHGGTIEIESTVGRGTRVLVLLPDLNAATTTDEGSATVHAEHSEGSGADEPAGGHQTPRSARGELSLEEEDNGTAAFG